MKVLHIIPSFALGGAEHVVLNYLMDFRRMPEVELMALSLYSRTNSINDQIIADERLNVKYAGCKPNDKLQIIRAVKDAVATFRPDIIHSHMRILPYVYIATIGRKIKIVHTIHTEPEVNSSGKIFLFDKFCVHRRKVLPICLNDEMAKRADNLYGISKTKYLYNGINLSRYIGMSSLDKIKLRASFGIHKDEMVLGHIGRFVPIKNHKLIINVFHEYLKIHPNSRLLLIGTGPELGNIKNQAKALHIDYKIIFAGARSDVSELLQVMDKYIFPSIVEGLGISVIEAQAAGLPCVISDIIPQEAVVSDNVIRVCLDSPIEDWISALDGEKRREGYSSIERYDIKIINRELLSIYNHCK